MSLLKLRSAPLILIEDDADKNILPLFLELLPSEKHVHLFCYEQSTYSWKSVFRNPNVQCHDEYIPELYDKYTSHKSTLLFDSINQMALCMGWLECLKSIKRLSSESNVEQIVIVLHKDCLLSKLQMYSLNHIANAVVSYNYSNPCKVSFRIKKGSKVTTSEEILSYDTKTNTLKSAPIIKQEKVDNEPEKPSPANLTTFKIEMDQLEKMEKSNLKLPYMSKIHEGESKVFYEPDAVDDWDEEDPDEDLDI